jgi:hypothetical protein
MKRQWLKDWPWETVVTINAGLCQEKKALLPVCFQRLVGFLYAFLASFWTGTQKTVKAQSAQNQK